jgi:hypothetical protein
VTALALSLYALSDKVSTARLSSLTFQVSRPWGAFEHPRLLASSNPRLRGRYTYSMASESLESSKGELRDRGEYASQQDGTPHAARGASATPASSAWFPLGYREGFSQWVCYQSREEAQVLVTEINFPVVVPAGCSGRA